MYRMLFLISLSVILSTGCQPKTAAKKFTGPADAALTTDAGRPATVSVRSENVRVKPNGRLLGSLRRGDGITILKRVGNWVQFTNSRFKEAYIWAPSVGYELLNLYSPDFYLNDSRKAFQEVQFFRSIFSTEGEQRQETGSSYELFFNDIGLGSHEVTVLDVVTESQQQVQHGITLFVNKNGERITRVRVDFFKPVKGYAAALKKCELPVKEPGENNSGHVIWNAGQLLPGIAVDLERQEWESDLFSSIWFIAAE